MRLEFENVNTNKLHDELIANGIVPQLVESLNTKTWITVEDDADQNIINTVAQQCLLNPLEDAQKAKIKSLDKACTNAILYGFEYTKDGNTYLIGFDTLDQANLTGQMAMLSVTTEPIVWKVKGQLIFLQFTKDEFMQMGLVAKQHKESNMQKYFGLCGQVYTCTSKEEVDAILW